MSAPRPDAVPAPARPAGHRVVLVAGGAGLVGGIIARGLVGDGHTVLVPSRSAGRVAALAEATRSAPGVLRPFELAGETGAERELAELLAAGPAADRPTAVVAALGGWSIGPDLLEIGDAAWSAALAGHLTSHLRAMQAYLPLLAAAGPAADPCYLTLNGAAAEIPMAGSGAVSVTGAGQRMLLEVMRAESIGRQVRLHELTVTAAVAGDLRNLDPQSQVTPSEVLDAVRNLLADPGSPALARVGGS